MSIKTKCGECGKTLTAQDSAAGKRAKCPQCGAVVQIPSVVDAVDAEDASEPAEEEEDWGVPAPPPRRGAASSSGGASAGGTDARKPCPACGEMIVATAAKCRFCGEIFDASLKRQEAKKNKKESRSYSSGDDDMTPVDWVLAILCPGIGCILGIVRVCTGKGSGGKMIGVSVGAMIFWQVIRVALETATKQGNGF